MAAATVPPVLAELGLAFPIVWLAGACLAALGPCGGSTAGCELGRARAEREEELRRAAIRLDHAVERDSELRNVLAGHRPYSPAVARTRRPSALRWPRNLPGSTHLLRPIGESALRSYDVLAVLRNQVALRKADRSTCGPTRRSCGCIAVITLPATEPAEPTQYSHSPTKAC